MSILLLGKPRLREAEEIVQVHTVWSGYAEEKGTWRDTGDGDGVVC